MWINKNSDVFLKIVLLCITLVFGGILFSLPFMWLWNWLMPLIFHLPKVTFFQSWGLILLSGILFKSSVYHASDKK